jgi:hypothetical protein
MEVVFAFLKHHTLHSQWDTSTFFKEVVKKSWQWTDSRSC